MSRIASTPVRLDPFPHIYVEDVFPGDFYDEIQRRMLDDSEYVRLVDTGRVGANYDPNRMCLFQDKVSTNPGEKEDRRFWAELFAAYHSVDFMNLWASVFNAQIAARIAAGHVPPGISGDTISTRAEIFLIRDGGTYKLSPHTDSPAKIVSVLFYLPRDGSRPDLGTTLYRPKKPGFTSDGREHLPRKDFDLVATMPYRPNTLFAFPRLEDSFHGVEASDATRRDLLLFDIKFAPAG